MGSTAESRRAGTAPLRALPFVPSALGVFNSKSAKMERERDFKVVARDIQHMAVLSSSRASSLLSNPSTSV